MSTAPCADSPPPYDAIVFDCDSTLSEVEGIEELAGEHRTEVARLTARAMDGELALEAVYGARLKRIQPTIAALERVAAIYLERALPHAADLVRALRALDKRVLVVSGGLLEAVRPFALALGVDAREVHAVPTRHDELGAYLGFDESCPLARAGGKPELLARLVEQPGAARVALVGDGATDLEAAPACARFVAFGGVVRREEVFARAVARCEVKDLAALVPKLLSPEERAALSRSPEHAPLVDAALPYLRT